MRWLAVTPLLAIGCTGDILPIQIPGPQFITEAGNLPGAMQQVRAGLDGPIAGGGGLDPLLLERRDGGWVPIDAPPEWRGPIHDVAVAQGRVFIAGDDGRFAIGDRDRLDLVATPDRFVLRGLFARAADDAFIAADGGLLHWDGQMVARVETASIADFHAIWGSGSTLFAVGAGGVALLVGGGSVEPTETGTTATLRAISGRSRSEIYAVGGDEHAAALRWDGARWIDFALPFMPPLNAVSAGSSGVWVCGDAGYLAKWDGTRWIEIGTSSQISLNGTFEQGDDLYLAAGNLEDPAAAGFLVRYGE